MTKAHFRAHGRRAIDLPAKIRPLAVDARIPSRVVDLSLGGARLETTELLEPGAGVAIEIQVPTLWDPLVLEGRIAWTESVVDKVRAGVEFEHQEGAPLVALLELLAAHSY